MSERPDIPDTEPKRWLDEPANVRKIVWAVVAVSFAVLLGDLVVKRYQDHPWESLFGFYAFYGFVSCVFLVLAAKEMRKLLMRREDYYDD